MLSRTGEDSKAAGVGVKVSRREGRRKGPTTHAIQSGEQASKEGLCDGNAGGGQGQMPMKSSPLAFHPLSIGGPVVEMFETGHGLSPWSLKPCRCFLPLCAPKLSPQALSHSKGNCSTVVPQATAASPH